MVGGAQFTHAAIRMGWVAAANACSCRARLRRYRFRSQTVPAVTFTQPEVARVGLTESEAGARHPGARVAHLPLTEVDRALIAEETDGFVTLIAGPRLGLGNLGGGRLLGATIVAPRAGEMIHEVILVMHANMFVGRLVQTVHAYATWSTAVQHAASQFLGLGTRVTARPAVTADDR